MAFPQGSRTNIVSIGTICITIPLAATHTTTLTDSVIYNEQVLSSVSLYTSTLATTTVSYFCSFGLPH